MSNYVMQNTNLNEIINGYRTVADPKREIAQPPCPLCGDFKNTSFEFERNTVAIYSCATCHVEFLYPQPSDETLTSIYSSDYFLGARDERAEQRLEALKRATARLYLDEITPHVKKKHPRLLEVGCGAGDFLIEARSRGFEVEGLEYSQHATEVACARLSCEGVRTGSLDTADLPARRYDVIAAFDVIEHVRNPVQSLRRLHSGLVNDGLLVLVTPSLDSWSRRLLGRYWMDYKTEHLTYFSRKSLTYLLQRTGYTSIEFISNYKVLSLDYIYRHFERYRVPFISSILRFLHRLLPSKLAQCGFKIVASGIMVVARKSG